MGRTAKLLRAGKFKKDRERIKLSIEQGPSVKKDGALKVFDSRTLSTSKFEDLPKNRSRKRRRDINENYSDEEYMDTIEYKQTRKFSKTDLRERAEPSRTTTRILDGRIDYVSLTESKHGFKGLKRQLELEEIKKKLKNK